MFAVNSWIDQNPGLETIHVTNSEIRRITNQKTPNEVLALVKIKNHQISSNFSRVLVLDDVRDPGNMGTIIRLCDWFGVDALVCSMNTVDIYNPKVVQSSMGSVFRTTIIYTDLAAYLEGVKSPIYGAFMRGRDIKNISFPEKWHLVVGNESNGITKDVSCFIDEKVVIKNLAKKAESLNVAIATSILLHEMSS